MTSLSKQVAGLDGRLLAEAATRARVPRLAVFAMLWGRGVPYLRAFDIADDACNEAYARSLNREFSGTDHYCKWLVRVACRCAVDLLRKQREAVPVALIQDVGDDTRDQTAMRRLVGEALDSLAEDNRLILIMRYSLSFTLDEMAERLCPDGEGSANAKRKRIKRRCDEALARLRECLVQHDFSLALRLSDPPEWALARARAIRAV
ncbi:MAG: sigma-70 family RNA polymerase sigma factor [Thermoguttaceae bacterium]